MSNNKAFSPIANFATIPSRNKGLGYLDHGIDESNVPGLGWNLLREDISLPAAVLEVFDRSIQDFLDQGIPADSVKAGDVLEFDETAPYLKASKPFSPEAMRRTIGRGKERGIRRTSAEWLQELRGPVELP